MKPPLNDAIDRVTGRARYAQDIPYESEVAPLHMAVVRSPHPHAVIEAIDDTAARELPGVVTVISAADTGDRRFGRFTRDYPVLAVQRVLFAGQPVAAVAAVDRATAQEAARRVNVSYQPLPAMLTPEDALAADAPAIHPDYDDYFNPVAGRSHVNIQGEDAATTGDPEEAFRDCDEVYDNTFTWSRSTSASMETHNCLMDATGPRVVVHASHKEPYKLRRDLAVLSERPEEDFEVRPVKIGGDFGSKGNPFVESIAYFLSVATDRPIRARLSFGEGLATTGARHSGHITLRTGLRDGKIHAHQTYFVLDGGAFVASKPMPKGILPMLGLAMGAYNVPHQQEHSRGVYTNTVQGSHVRSPGEFQTIFASESHLEMIARQRGEDPLEFKSRNLASPVSQTVMNMVQQRAQQWSHGDQEIDGLHYGVGYSIFHRSAGPGESTVRLTAGKDGVLLEVTTPDQGAGAFDTFRSLVAQNLGVPTENIQVRGRSTDSGLVDMGAGASRVTVVVGRACVDACQQLLAQLGAAETSDAAEAIGNLTEEVSVLGRGEVARDAVNGLGHGHGALALQVSVDPETGFIRTHKAALAVDVGPILNPVGLRGQLEGGFVYGLSQTLFEDLLPDAGVVDLDSFNDYKLASGVDIPSLEIEFHEPQDIPETGMQGVRAVGELVNIGVPAAVANALDDAVGVRVTSLPLSAEKILTALQK